MRVWKYSKRFILPAETESRFLGADSVMAGLVPAIHVVMPGDRFRLQSLTGAPLTTQRSTMIAEICDSSVRGTAWMAGTSPAMTRPDAPLSQVESGVKKADALGGREPVGQAGDIVRHRSRALPPRRKQAPPRLRPTGHGEAPKPSRRIR